MTARAHVWIVECREPGGEWEPMAAYSFYDRSVARSEARFMRNRADDRATGRKFRVRKYERAS